MISDWKPYDINKKYIENYDNIFKKEMPLQEILDNLKPLDPEYSKTVDDNFWDLCKEEEDESEKD